MIPFLIFIVLFTLFLFSLLILSYFLFLFLFSPFLWFSCHESHPGVAVIGAACVAGALLAEGDGLEDLGDPWNRKPIGWRREGLREGLREG